MKGYQTVQVQAVAGAKCRPAADDYWMPSGGQAGAELQRLWRFYLDTGFLYPAKLEQLRPYLPEIFSSWEGALAAGEKITKLVSLEKQGRLLNALAMTRIYPRTWLVHQMASRSNPEGMLRVLLEAANWLMKKPGLEYARLYWRPGNHKVNKMFLGLAQAFRRGGARCIDLQSFHYHHLPIPELLRRLEPSDGSLRVRRVSRREYPRLAARLAQVLEPEVLKAEALDPGSLDLAALSRVYGQQGLWRGRTILTAGRGNQIWGLALVEHASLGLNFSYYLNTYRLVFLRPDLTGPQQRQLVHGLLRAVARFYLDLGRDFMVTMCPLEQEQLYQKLGFDADKRYDCLTLSQPPQAKIALDYLNRFYRAKLRQIRLARLLGLLGTTKMQARPGT